MVTVSVVRCDSYGHAKEAVERALGLIGGIEAFIKPGDRVLFKPNLLSAKPPSAAITTHPKILEAVIGLLDTLDVELSVGDSSGGLGMTGKALKTSGIRKIAEKLGADVVNFDREHMQNVRIPHGKVLKEVVVAKAVLDADVVISLPKLKTHALTLYTGAVKNMFGAIPGGNKSLIHSLTGSSTERFAEALVDIFSIMPVDLILMDGIVGMEGLGPHHGKPINSRVILASSDSIALDAVSSSIMGFYPRDIPTLRIAAERGLGTTDLDAIEITGEKLEDVKVDFKKPIGIYKGLMYLPAFVRNAFVESSRLPVASGKKCAQCGICKESCPVDAIEIRGGPEFDFKKCIQCYCCYELCPEGSITLKKPFFPRRVYGKRRRG